MYIVSIWKISTTLQLQMVNPLNDNILPIAYINCLLRKLPLQFTDYIYIVPSRLQPSYLPHKYIIM